jgi:GDP-mannose 6-dehydrogenase
VGLGYVGVTAACCLAKQGHEVVGVEINPKKVDELNAGICPISEPGLDELLTAGLAAGRLSASVDFPAENDDFAAAIVCVGTPSGPDGSHDMSYVAEATKQVATALNPNRTTKLTIVFRSTFRPGSMDELIAPILRDALGDDFESIVELVYNPEFLRESTAIDDYFNPSKIVIGTRDGQPSATMEAIHDGIEGKVFNVPFREAEFTKFADNTWHAVKVTYANELGRICSRLGVDASIMYELFIADTRLNISPYYLRPGSAFGGSCLPKDVRAMQHMALMTGANAQLINSVVPSNESHKEFHFHQITQLAPPGSRVLLAGLAFKAGTDDLRESPNVDIARRLTAHDYKLDVFDPDLDPDRLVGKNLGFAYHNLPAIAEILVSKATAESRDYDLVIRSNRNFEALDLGGVPVYDLERM